MIDKNILSAFEANLCSILYAVLGDTSIGQVMPKVRQSLEYQGCLSRVAIHLVQDALAKGMTHWLAVRGGWHSDRHLRDGVALTGAIWQRSAPSDLGLTFSPASLDFLIWLTANDPLAVHADPSRLLKDLTVGDQLLILRVLLRFQDTEITERLVRMRALAELPLVALVFPRQVSLRQNHVVPKFDESLPELGWVLECLQSFLAARWLDMELNKSTITDVNIMRRTGAMQTALLSSFFDAAEQHGRFDLARFLLAVFLRLVGNEVPPEQLARRWVSGLQLGTMRLADRTIVYQSASSFLAAAERLRKWTDQSKQVGYFDEGYAAAQLWLADWARYDGEHTTLKALAMIRALSI